MKKIKILQAYRGVAALIVILFHINIIMREKLGMLHVFDIFKIGHVGVDFFFVLSGFLIMLSYLKNPKKTKNLYQYFLKRFIRIYPVYWIICALVVTVYLFMGKNITFLFHIDPGFIIRTITLFPQWPHLIPTAWTLSFEVYFYIFFGLCLYFLTLNQIIVLSAAYAVGLFILNYLVGLPKQIIPVDFYILEFLLGMVSAGIVHTKKSFPENAGWKIFSVSIAAIVIAWLVYYRFDIHAASIQKYRVFSFGILFAVLIISSTWLEYQQKIQIPQFLEKLGDASFSIFLLHPSILLFTSILMRDVLHPSPVFGTVIALFLLVLSIGVPLLFYAVVEKPFIKSMLPTKIS